MSDDLNTPTAAPPSTELNELMKDVQALLISHAKLAEENTALKAQLNELDKTMQNAQRRLLFLLKRLPSQIEQISK